MSDTTAISWCDATFNPWWGCQKVSPACDHCYAERDAKRFAPGRVLWGLGSERRTFNDKHWQQPLKWAKTMPAKLGRRPRVFCASMADWLDLDAPIADFVRLLDTIRLTPELDWLLLSKRIGNARQRLNTALDAIGDKDEALALWDWITAWLNGQAGYSPANVWLGSTVINQAEADRDIPKLLAVPSRVRFLSIEPMLGDIDLSRALWQCCGNPVPGQPGDGWMQPPDPPECCGDRVPVDRLHWVIAGGESGPKARPSHPDWFRSLRDQCAAAGVPFHFKQNGEWVSCSEVEGPGDHFSFSDGATVRRTGKKLAGRTLDGATHDCFPVASRGREGVAA